MHQHAVVAVGAIGVTTSSNQPVVVAVDGDVEPIAEGLGRFASSVLDAAALPPARLRRQRRISSH